MAISTAAAKVGVEGVLPALAEPTRVRLIALLGDGETCVCHLVTALALPQPVVSRHLGVLRRAGLVAARRDGRWMWYRLVPGATRLSRALVDAVLECRDELPGYARAAQRCARSQARPDCCK
jgi:ArsR family transcriptional regulator